jgi:hypothetical protein
MSFTKKQEEEMEIDLKEIEKEKEEQIRRDEREKIIDFIGLLKIDDVFHEFWKNEMGRDDVLNNTLDMVITELKLSGGKVKIGDSRDKALKLGKGLRRPIEMPKPEKIFMEDGTPRCPYCHKAMHNVIDKSGISKYIWECDCPRTKDLLLSVG